MLEEDTKSLNEIKALVETYQSFYLFREKNNQYYEERAHLTINERRKCNGFSTTLIELTMTARQKESSLMEVQTS